MSSIESKYYEVMMLHYLKKTNHLTRMEDNCNNFVKKLNEESICKFPSIRILLEIDVSQLLNIFPDLYDLLINEPLKWRDICDEILFSCLQSVDKVYNKNMERAQAAVNIRLKCVPKVLHSTNVQDYDGLKITYGLLLNVSQSVSSYAYQTVWSCSEECEGNEVILQYIPKVPPKCFRCDSVLFENSGLRRCGDQVKATFILKEYLQPKHFIIIDDLIPKLKLGSKYELHIVALKKTVTVWSLEEVIPLKAPINTPISRDLEILNERCAGVSWKFIYCLASGIGANISPLNCFMHLKLSLLLSLTSIKANIVTGSSIVHVLSLGSDTGFAVSIMNEAGKLAERSVCLDINDSSVITSFVASSGGVCIIPSPLNVYNQKQVSSIRSAIEKGEIMISETRKINLKCAVWAQGVTSKKIDLKHFVSIFSITCRDYGEYNDEMIAFKLQQAIDCVNISAEEKKALKDVSDYIDSVAGLEVTLNKETETFLKKYFVAARKESPNCVAVGSMEALAATCTTSARLCRRKLTNVDDAVLAIWLHVSGTPKERFAPDDYLESPGDVKKLQTMMNSFKDWLEYFTSNVIS